MSFIEYTMGDFVDLGDPSGNGIPDQCVDSLRSKGFRRFSNWQGSPLALAFESASKTLRSYRSQQGAPDISHVIYVSNSFSKSGHDYSHDVCDLLSRLELSRAELSGMFLSGCASIFFAIRTAKDIISQNKDAVCLVISSDVTPDGSSRLLFDDYAVFGDASTAFIIHSREMDGVSLLGFGASFDASLAKLEPSNPQYTVRVVQRMREAFSMAMRDSIVGLEDISSVFMSNLQLRSCLTSLASFGLDPNLLYAKTMADHGHCNAGDAIINLAHGIAHQDVPVQRPVLLYFQSVGSWAALIAKRSV